MKSHRTWFRKSRRPGQNKRRPNAWQFEPLEARSLLSGSGWQNPINALDVSNDGKVTPFDALMIVNDLNANGPRRLLASSGAPALAALALGATSAQASSAQPTSAYIDVSGDGSVTPMDMLLVANALNGTPPSVRIRLATTDLAGNAITSITQGGDFLLKAFVQDLRTPPPVGNTATGVFAGYLDVTYNSALATIDPTQGKATTEEQRDLIFGQDDDLASDFDFSRKYLNGRTFDLNTAGLVNDTGAFASLSRLGSSERNLWILKVHAAGVGHVNFVPDPADDAGHEVLLYDESDPVPNNQVDFVSAGFDIVTPAGPTLSINDISKVEGNSSTTNFVFTVTLSAASAQTVNVNFTTNAGTATAPADFTATSGILTFNAGVLTQPVTVAVKGDTLNEANETFFVDLSGAVNASIADGQGLGTITNDDPLPSLTIGDVSLAEGNSGSTNFVFAVSLSAGSGQQVKVNFATSNGTASAGSDYTATSGTLTFDPGAATQNVTVAVNGDTAVEANETFTVTLSTPINATILDAQATGTIQNDDSVVVPSISINDVFRPEGNSGTSNAVFTVTLSNSSAQQVTVAFATANGAAIAGIDYTAASGTLTFSAGATTQNITVAVKGDTLNESDENFFVNLSGATNATIGDNQGQCTIQDDDAQPSLSIGDVTQAEGNAGTTNFVFAVTLSAASGNTVTVNFATADGTATAPSDYTANNGTLTFAAGVTSRNVTVGVKGDILNEPNENFLVNLSGAAGATIGDNQAVGTITNDDTGPGLSINDITLAEGNAGTTNFVFTVTLAPTSGQQVTVAYSTANGTANDSNDYAAQSGTLTFAPGVGSQQVTIGVSGDTLSEANETFLINLSNATNAAIADNQATGTITNDDALPTLSIDDVSLDEGNSGTTNAVFTVTMSAVSGQVVTVNFATADGNSATTSDNARSPSDYTATSGTLTFAEGTTSKTITVVVKGDQFFESDQSFTVNLTAPVGAALADGQGVGTIVNDDEEGQVEPSNFSGVVYIDANNNGVQDNGEQGIAGATVHLTGTSEAGDPIDEQTTSDADGAYEFIDIAPGEYHIIQTQPAFFLDGQTTPGTEGTEYFAANTFRTAQSDGGINSINNNFGERGLRPEFISKRGYLASSASTNAALTALNLTAGPAWFSFDAGWDGLLTAQAASGFGPANVDLTLYDNSLHVLATSTGGSARLDYQGVVGQPYFLRVGGSGTNVDLTLTNVVHQDGDKVTIRGTRADDDFQFIAGVKDTVVINGTSYQFDPAKVKSIVFDGGAGTNSVTLTGAAGDDVADLHLGFGSLTGAGYSVSASNVSSIAVNSGGGNDTVTLHDSAFSDHLSADGDWLSLANDLGFATSVQGFSRVRASSTAGGADTLDVQAINFIFEHDGPWTG